MMMLDVSKLGYQALNEEIRKTKEDITITGCIGQRFIATGMSERNITIEGVPGNALGAYLNGANITAMANVQDAVGDTMNDGKIIVHGNVGDAVGYAMRGGKIFIKGNAGYRAGIHMKAYKEKKPLMIIGGNAGSFLGEYQAGGVIIVLGLGNDNQRIVGNFPCTGMHGGKLFLRNDCNNIEFPSQVNVHKAEQADIDELKGYLSEYCDDFGFDIDEILKAEFTVVTPNSKNPYKQMYVAN